MTIIVYNSRYINATSLAFYTDYADPADYAELPYSNNAVGNDAKKLFLYNNVVLVHFLLFCARKTLGFLC